jgi:hypothetical protein
MKANEAQEKLYLSKNIYRNPLYRVPDNDDKSNIEYTRADAVIEKAWDWIEDNMLTSNQRDKSRLYFEQFKKYMKGE